MTAEDEVSAVERVTQHRPLVDEDVLDGGGSVAGHSRTTVRSGSRKKRPPTHESLSVIRRKSDCLAENHDAGDASKVRPHFVADGGVEEETAQHAEKDIGDEDHIGRLSICERDFGNERETDVESGRE